MTKRFKYDAAFSFLSAHEATALRVSDGLNDRLSTFVYSRHQSEIIGRVGDGVEVFTNVFRHECRVSVVLHSEGWGTRGYTHIEEAAIKERALEEGWDFLIVVCLDEAKPPKWIPNTKIWYGFEKFGLEGLLATIDHRVTELGGRPKPDSIVEKAARAQREADFSEKKRHFSTSTSGRKAAQEEVDRLPDIAAKRIELLNDVSPRLELQFARNRSPYESGAISSRFGSVVWYWQTQFWNSLTGAQLLVVEWSGRFIYHGVTGNSSKVASVSAIPTIDYAGHVVWEVAEVKEPLGSEALIDHFLERIIQGRPSQSPSIYFLQNSRK
jgi:hypothetical protein